MKRIITFSGLVVTICLLASACGWNNSKKQAGSESEEADNPAESEQVAKAEPINLFEKDFIVKYTKYGWDIASDFSGATRNEAADATWEITKKGDTMTIIENSAILNYRQSITTVMKEADGNVEVTVTKSLDGGEHSNTSTRLWEGTNLAKKAESWFVSKGEGQKGAFVLGSGNPQYDSSDMDVTVTKGDKMFGRCTNVYTSKPKKGSIIESQGYNIGKRQIIDAETLGYQYVKYKAWAWFNDGEEHLTFEVTDFKILN